MAGEKQSSNEKQSYEEIAATRHEDELARRRERRLARLRETEGGQTAPRVSNLDVFAFIIAAFQILGPILLALIGVVMVIFFLFRLFFT